VLGAGVDNVVEMLVVTSDVLLLLLMVLVTISLVRSPGVAADGLVASVVDRVVIAPVTLSFTVWLSDDDDVVSIKHNA